jgi:hypothetical protein
MRSIVLARAHWITFMTGFVLAAPVVAGSPVGDGGLFAGIGDDAEHAQTLAPAPRGVGDAPVVGGRCRADPIEFRLTPETVREVVRSVGPAHRDREPAGHIKSVPIATAGDDPLPVGNRRAIVAHKAAEGSVEVTFDLANRGVVRLDVYDVRGRQVARLELGFFAQGSHVLRWDGRDLGGHDVASGVYILRLQTTDGVATTKVALVQ